MRRIIASSTFAAVLCLALLMFCGCGDNSKDLDVNSVKIASGSGQCALPGETFSRQLRVELLGSPKGKLLADNKQRPVPGHEIFFVPVDGSSLTVEPSVLKTDVTGTAAVTVKAGKVIGDQYLRVIPAGAENLSRTVRFVVGTKLSGGEQEWWTGDQLPEPVSIELINPDGKPASGVPVYFSVISGPERKNTAKVLTPSTTTDRHGRASTQVKLGKATGEYEIGVEVADLKSGLFIRSNRFRVLGVDLPSVIITVLGGLAFFIFGMKMMGDGLLKIAGENMKRVLQFFSRNGFVAILAGTAVTAVIQSSSATTVMVVGFINAGLLSLQQAVGIIFGANIGTTVTAQIISFNLDGLALPAVIVGFLMMALFKKRVITGWGETILGFGMLFFGMGMMSGELKLLGNFPTFVSFFRAFDCAPVAAGGFMPFAAVLGAILIGIVATFVIQSSSAAMGIVLALAAGGLINFYTAVPLLLGTNIGTTITMFLASLAANRVAKQAALAHFMFNVIGTVLMVALFYVPYGPGRIPVFLYFINSITPGDAFAAIPQNVTRHIAMAHTLFNIMAVMVIFPIMGLFTKMCEKLLPIRDSASMSTTSLEPHLLATPSVALEQVVVEIRKMVLDSWTMIDQVVNKHFLEANVDAEAFRELKEKEKKVDAMQIDVTNYLVQITRRNLTQHQSDLIPLLMHCTNDAERIADHSETIMKLTKRLAKAGVKLSDVAKKDLNALWELLDNQAKNVALALDSTDRESVKSVLASEKRINKLAKKYEKDYTKRKESPALQAMLNEDDHDLVYTGHENTEISDLAMENEREINQLTRQYEQEHVSRRNEGKCSVEGSVVFIELLWELERLGDHLANIAVRTPEIQKHYISLKK